MTKLYNRNKQELIADDLNSCYVYENGWYTINN